MKTLTEDQKKQVIAHIEATQPKLYWDYNSEISNSDIIKIINGDINEVENEIFENNIDYIDELCRECVIDALYNCGIDIDVFDISYDQWYDLMDRTHVDINMRELTRGVYTKVRITLRSYYDCINSNYYENQSGYEYGENYFTDMVNFLQINPSELQMEMNKVGFATNGTWPNITGLNPIVSIADILTELSENIASAANFTIIGKIKLSDVGDKITKIVCHKDTYAGLYDEHNGGGSMMECKILRDVEIDLTKTGATEYDRVVLISDVKGSYGYCTDEVYGLTGQCFKAISIVNDQNK